MFFNDDKYPWLKDFNQHFDSIKKELTQIKHLPEKPLYENTWGNENRPTYLNKSENKNARWDTFVFKFFGIKHIPNSLSCPITASLIEKYPQIITAEFSMIQPNTHILPHTGYSDLYKRAHLGIEIPQGDLGLKVNGETRLWQKNKWLIFDDSLLHEAWNRTNEERVVLMIDFVENEANALPFCKDIINKTNDNFIFNIAPKELWLQWIDKGSFPLSLQDV